MDAHGRADVLEIADKTFTSRLIVGTGKYASHDETVAAIRASGAEMVTVAVRRVDLDATNEESLLAHLSPEEFFLLPNTAGCYSVEEAVRYARLGRAAGLSDWIKLEVIGDRRRCCRMWKPCWKRPGSLFPRDLSCSLTRTTI